MKKTSAWPFLIHTLLLLLALLLSIAVGSVFIPIKDIFTVFLERFNGNTNLSKQLQTYTNIIFNLRLPRTFLVALTGAALAVSGGAYQGLFYNPLADPYLIGVASGAGLGAILAITLQWPNSLLGYLAIPASAFLGALLTVFIVYQLARAGRSLAVTNLILAGVAVSAFASAFTSFLLINASGEIRRAIVWLMGGSTLVGWKPVVAVAPYIFIGIIILFLTGYQLNVLQFGEEQAQQLGVHVKKVRNLIIIAATLTTAAAVAFSGIIGFVGLIVPHVIRNLWGNEYQRLLPLSVLAGAFFLLISDVLARILMAPQELPVGIITALFGAPFFLYILKKSKKQYW